MTSTSNQGRVAVVTGASSGIGAAAARALAAIGYRAALLAAGPAGWPTEILLRPAGQEL